MLEIGARAGAGTSKGTFHARLDGAPVIAVTGDGVAREHRFLSALAGTAVPVPEVLAWYPDETLVLSEVAAGGVLTLDPAALDPVALAHQAVDVLAALHAVSPDAVEAPPGRYLERQIRRWSRQLAATPTAPRLGDLAPITSWLTEHLPPTEERCLVHGDFGFHNLLVTGDSVVAVVDWELATVGDPLADLVFFVKSWGTDALSRNPAQDAVALRPGAPTRRALEARYEAKTGRQLEPYRRFYDVFTLWRSIGIQEGVHARSGILTDEVPAMVATAMSLAAR